MIKRKLQTMAEISEQTMVEEVERRLANHYADVPAERISAIVRGLTRISNRVGSGTLCRCSSSDAPGLNSPRPGNV